MHIDDAAALALKINTEKGYHNEAADIPKLLCLIHSEVSECLEGHRQGRFANTKYIPDPSLHIDHFEAWIKNTYEDELADIIIRVLDLAALTGVCIGSHVEAKLAYNANKPRDPKKTY